MMRGDLPRRLLAEALGSAFLTGAVIGSGVMASRLAGGDAATALLANTLATAAMLYVLVAALAPVSGAHFNPAVTLAAALKRAIGARAAMLYVLAQIAGCIAGVVFAHAMFALPLISISTTARAGGAQMLSEAAATFALVFAILGVARWRAEALPAAVALVIAAGYWWTPSTSFANPAITLARALSDTFAGVRPQDAPGFIAAQFAGGLGAFAVATVLFPRLRA